MQIPEGIFVSKLRCFPTLMLVSLCSTYATSSWLRQFTQLPTDSSSLFRWLREGSHSFLYEPVRKLCCDFGLFSYIKKNIYIYPTHLLLWQWFVKVNICILFCTRCYKDFDYTYTQVCSVNRLEMTWNCCCNQQHRKEMIVCAMCKRFMSDLIPVRKAQ